MGFVQREAKRRVGYVQGGRLREGWAMFRGGG